MKRKMLVASLMLAALPLAAQADNAAQRALALHQEPLSEAAATPADDAHPAEVHAAALGGSEAMAQARLRLDARAPETHIAAGGDATRLGRLATQG
ncbi:hypothetical protein [Halomonas koreensis]|uniref:Phage infection protein n=1 Tax=Halomonas koreensis TaxID=245385 RepID=A0ABU1G359_9GAMM|nr:hypothetical protein [Halomonas koreensis]MDR5866937.1 hypothetical protein [Halomonas koreensis]